MVRTLRLLGLAEGTSIWTEPRTRTTTKSKLVLQQQQQQHRTPTRPTGSRYLSRSHLIETTTPSPLFWARCLPNLCFLLLLLRLHPHLAFGRPHHHCHHQRNHLNHKNLPLPLLPHHSITASASTTAGIGNSTSIC